VPEKPSVQFSSSPRAVQVNTELLVKYDFELERLLDSESGTTVDYGSEFRPIPQLEQLMGSHLNFEPLAQIVSNGMYYRYSRTMVDAERTLKRTSLLVRSNHKSANDEPDQIDRLLKKEVYHGFAIPVPIDEVGKIKLSASPSN
jgi:hypothetical protein